MKENEILWKYDVGFDLSVWCKPKIRWVYTRWCEQFIEFWDESFEKLNEVSSEM